MRRVLSVFGSVVLLVGLGSAADSLVKTKHALDLELSGSLDIGAVYRNQKFHGAYYGPTHVDAQKQVSRANGSLAEGRKIAPSIVQDSGSLFLIDPQLSLGLKATMKQNVVAVVELATPFYVIGDEGGTSSFGSMGLLGDSIYEGTQLEDRRYLEIEQVYVEFRDILARDSGLDLRLGITDYALDFRENGHPFLIDVQNSENPFLSPTGSQQYLIMDTQTGNPVWDVKDADSRRIAATPNGRNSQDAAGVLARYATENELVTLDTYIFDIFESYESNRDDWVIGSTATFYFDEDRQTGKIAPTALLLLNDSRATMATLGGGIQYFPMPEKVLELYTEGYGQFGHYARGVNIDAGPGGLPPARRLSTITQQGAYAFYAGMRVQAPKIEGEPEEREDVDFFGGWQPYLDLSYWEISGDTKAQDTKNEAFVSLENNNQTLIVESSYWGLDIDTNYRAFRVEAGFYPLESLHVATAFASFHLHKNNGTADNHVGSKRNKIGDELDLILSYEYSTHVTMQLGTGFLWDARALGETGGLNLTMARLMVDF